MKKYFLEISSERKNIQKVEELMLNINKIFGLPEDEYNKMMIAVTEIAMNAIVHGNKESMLKKVKLYVEHDEKTIKVMVFDEGDGFEIGRLPDPTDMENILDVHGRGVFIARAMVDEFYYHNDEGKGSEFVMIVNKK
ncbi:MAG TPA: ATP-binding protein [Ignavibacteria bacterium]|nr:ATP-binding protein [Ignavibacteria bacterium]HRE12362.1 ATP-binding protein [Ignavibacteria bacterium]HRF66875.1 ATP-binding protein [Ignavibacteria bacterium]HRJ03757.1 ATP-binding protein [Ignavibacteria bacterium]